MIDAGRLFGRGISFPPRVGPDGRLVWSEGESNIRESIRVILTTEPSERLRLPEFGGGLRRFLFEPNTVATRHDLSECMRRALEAWEPRIRVEAIDVLEDPRDAESAIATVVYRLVATATRERVSLSVKLGTGAGA